MIEFRARIFRILLFLLPANCCFAATIYVNINNPTPGTGTSWATAYKDLNLALAAANYGDQVWVAQGTYKPTTTTDRTISFQINLAISVYGGFTGVETSLGARNWTTNVTILSGDIGVAGDPSDNTYNVLTINSNFSSATLDGFTIRDGNGNQNYPATTTIQPYNQAGGILCNAGTNGYVGAWIDHCILTDNFGVYGGGICCYAHGTSSVMEVTIVHDLFLNNTAVMGAGVAYISQNGGAGLTDVESCIFNGNTSTGTGGSAIMADGDANSALCSMNVDNSTFYNNPAPLLNKTVLNSGTMNFNTSDCILWQAAGPYSSPLTTGAALNLNNCDVDLATPGSGNINSDPKFVDAPGGDFHLQPCSPDIDMGGLPIMNSNQDYGGNPRIQNNSIDWGAYESAPGSSTLSPDISGTSAIYCQNSTAVALTAPGGTNLLWYTAATGGTGSAVAPVPATTTTGMTTWWVTQTVTGECESNRTTVTVTVNPQPAAPTASAQIYCENTPAAALTATGTALLWYTASTGGTGSAIAPVPATAATGMTTWYVSQTSGCESDRTPVTVTVNPQPAPPTASAQTYCENTPAAALTATGTALLWYTAATGGTGSAIAPVPATTTTGMTTWYVSQTGGCESDRTPVTVTVNPQPAPPTASAQTWCENTPAAALTATGTALLWYTAATGGTGSAIAPVPATATTGMTIWYVSQTSGCESDRTPVTVTVNPQPAAPTASAQTWCENTPAAALTATGTALLWYTAATGGTGSAIAPVPATATAGMTTWYVSQTSGCESDRTPVTVTVNPQPAAPTASAQTWCENTPAAALTATGTALLWYTAATGGTGSAIAPVPATATTGMTIWYVSQTSGCESDRTPVTVTVFGLPKIDIGPVPGNLCAGSSIILQASGATDYQWSPVTDLSNAAIYDPTVVLQNNISYTVTGTDANGCTATAQVALEIGPDCLGYYLPNAFTPNGDGRNDQFRVKTSDEPRSFHMLIFNRFGGKIFETANISSGWNGTIGGSPATPGTYVYMIAITTSAGSVIEKKGTVELIR